MTMIKAWQRGNLAWDKLERARWKSGWQSVMSMIAATAGLGSIWSGYIPYSVDRFGGAFLLAHALLTALVGIPVLTLEMAIGQFTLAPP
jgi:SNF family Na+-dependent transporter